MDITKDYDYYYAKYVTTKFEDTFWYHMDDSGSYTGYHILEAMLEDVIEDREELDNAVAYLGDMWQR